MAYIHQIFENELRTGNPQWANDTALTNLLNALQQNPRNPANVRRAIKSLPKDKQMRYQSALVYAMKTIGPSGIVATIPLKYSEVTNTRVAGMYLFSANNNVEPCCQYLYQHGVRTMISIEKTNMVSARATWLSYPFFEPKTHWFGTFLADWHAPSAAHLAAYCKTVETQLAFGKVVTHCWGGTGRTGCFLAAYLIKKETLTAHAALKRVRTDYSHESVEMKAQYNALARYADSLGRPPSKQLQDLDANDIAGGHWHGQYGDDGINSDPGHKGTGSKSPNLNVMVSSQGIASTNVPYVSTDINLMPKTVP